MNKIMSLAGTSLELLKPFMFFYGVGVGEKEWFASHYAVQLLTLPFYLTNVERNKKSPI